jgi:hypothetical protein
MAARSLGFGQWLVAMVTGADQGIAPDQKGPAATQADVAVAVALATPRQQRDHEIVAHDAYRKPVSRLNEARSGSMRPQKSDSGHYWHRASGVPVPGTAKRRQLLKLMRAVLQNAPPSRCKMPSARARREL